MTAEIKIHRVYVEPSTGRDGLDRRFQPGRIGLLDGLALIPASGIHGHKARRRHGDFAGGACTQWRFALWLWLWRCGFQQRFKIGRVTANEKVGGVLHALRPLDEMDSFDQRRQDFRFQPFGSGASRFVVVEAQEHFPDGIGLEQRLVVCRPAVRSVNRNHVPKARLPQRQPVQNRFGNEQGLIGLGAPAVPYAPMRAGQIQVGRLGVGDAPAVNAADVALPVKNRHGDTVFKMLAPVGLEHAQRFEAVQNIFVPGQHLEQRTVAVTDLKSAQRGRLGQLAAFQVVQARRVFGQRLDVEAHHPLQQIRRVAGFQDFLRLG